jgi:cation diffusion facilitator CzcD-associated flavoprotein CzcO
MTDTDVTIIGAGPYGLAAAAHLKSIKGLEVRVFGEPMGFWEKQMPSGMILRSAWTATHIASPDGRLSLEDYQNSTGELLSKKGAHGKPDPVKIEGFIRYGQWYQSQVVPELDRRNVSEVRSAKNGFRITLADGESFSSRRVVIAAGIAAFAWKPPEFANVPGALASHASEHRDLKKFAGKNVLVVGSGQSALESAALIHEAGGNVEVVGRAESIAWLAGRLSTTLHWRLGAGVRKFLYAPTDVGPAGLSQLCARPDLIKRLPRSLQDRIRKRAVRPAGARWLVSRLATVPIHLGRRISSVSEVGGKLRVVVSDGTEHMVDHALLGTGYRVDISKYPFLAPELIGAVERCGGYPVLRQGLETSISGLHILGSPAAWSLGPLMQFVSGTTYAGNVLRQFVASKSGKN